MDRVAFFVEGEPRAKQSFRVTARRGRMIGGYTPARVKAWQEAVSYGAQLAMRRLGMFEPMEGSLSVELTFFLGNARRTDNDNLSKAICDSLNKVIWVDDRQIATLIIHKFICRGRQGVLVVIERCDRKGEVSVNELEHTLAMAGCWIELASLREAPVIP